MFAEAIEAILRDQCTPAGVHGIESGGAPQALWEALEGAGFLELLAPEDSGGAGLALAELYPVLVQFGRHAVPVPAAQAVVARALVPSGTEVPSGLLTLAPSLQVRRDGAFVCPLVPFGIIAQHVLGSDGSQLHLLDVACAERIATGIHGSQAATLVWRNSSGARLVGDDVDRSVESFGAALHAALLAGALTRVFELTLQYCNDRVQFGRSLGKFQAVQHQLAVMAEHVAAAGMAAEAAFQTDRRSPQPLAAALAKARTSEAALLVANLAHALHGAIGVTEEYDLQLFTRRLHEWRMAHGSEAYWNQWIGEALLEAQQPLAEFVRAA
jgi:alkylation response protein AidB-like acyl-CoA dehydrogenase